MIHVMISGSFEEYQEQMNQLHGLAQWTSFCLCAGCDTSPKHHTKEFYLEWTKLPTNLAAKVLQYFKNWTIRLFRLAHAQVLEVTNHRALKIIKQWEKEYEPHCLWCCPAFQDNRVRSCCNDAVLFISRAEYFWKNVRSEMCQWHRLEWNWSDLI